MFATTFKQDGTGSRDNCPYHLSVNCTISQQGDHATNLELGISINELR